MVTLFDLGAEFWRNALGGKDAMLGYEQTMERLDWYRRHGGPEFIVCADSPRSARKELDPTYKAQRPPKPQDAVDALQGIIERVRAWGTPVALVDGWEADDAIASLTAQAWPAPVCIVGTEKDFYCLIDDERGVYLMGRAGRVDSAACFDKFGVSPSQMTDWLCLAGDASDGIPGCENCGPGRATKLLDRFVTIEGVLAASDEEILSLRGIGNATLASLRAWDPEPTRAMVRMRTDLPISLMELLYV